MTLLERFRARLTRIGCRDEHGHQGAIIPLPRSGDCGVVLQTPIGEVSLDPLEVGRLRAELRDKLIESAELLAAQEAAVRAQERDGAS